MKYVSVFSQNAGKCGENEKIRIQMRENAGKMQTRITLNTDIFYAVVMLTISKVFTFLSTLPVFLSFK